MDSLRTTGLSYARIHACTQVCVRNKYEANAILNVNSPIRIVRGENRRDVITIRMCYDEKCRGELIFVLSLSLSHSLARSFLFSSLFLSRREDRMKIDSTLIVTFHSLDDDNGETSVPINLFPRELY